MDAGIGGADVKKNLLDSIELFLEVYAGWVSRGRGKRSDESESLYCDLLNTAFGYNLKNMNWVKDNFPAIDLGDDTEKLAVQITSTKTPDKVKRTLERFFNHNLNQQYERLIVLVSGEAQIANEKAEREGVEVQVWGTSELVQELWKLPLEKLEEVYRFLTNRVNMLQPKRTVLNLPPTSTLNASNFVGRDVELQKIGERIKRGDKLIILSGLGGIGKTELVVKFGKDYRDGKVYFVRFNANFTRTLGDMYKGIQLELTKEQLAEPDAVRCRRVLELLSECGSSDILIIDNVDSSTKTLYELMDDDAFQYLQKLNIRLILTSRLNHDDSEDVFPMPNENLFEIFRQRGLSLEESMMLSLIEAVEGNTLTIDLIARTLAAKNLRRVTAEDMLTALNENTLPTQKGRPVGTTHDQFNKQERIYDHLRRIFSVTDISEEEKNILRCATLLPGGGMKGELFVSCLTEEAEDKIYSLQDHGWLGINETVITIHPVIRLVCREELKPMEDIHENFLHTLWDQCESKKLESTEVSQVLDCLFGALVYQLKKESDAEEISQLTVWLIRVSADLLNRCSHRKADFKQAEITKKDDFSEEGSRGKNLENYEMYRVILENLTLDHRYLEEMSGMIRTGKQQ